MAQRHSKAAATDGLVMTQRYFKAVLQIEWGWPNARCFRQPPVGPELPQSSATSGLKLACRLYKEAVPIKWNWPSNL